MLDANLLAHKPGKILDMGVDMDKVRSAVLNWKDKVGGAPAAVAAVKKATGYVTTRQNLETFLSGGNPKYELLHGLARAMGHVDTDGLMELRPVGAPRPSESSELSIHVVVDRLSQVLAQDLPADVRRDAAYLLQQLAELGAVKRHRVQLVGLLEAYSRSEIVAEQTFANTDMRQPGEKLALNHRVTGLDDTTNKETTTWGHQESTDRSSAPREVDITPRTPGKQPVMKEPGKNKPGKPDPSKGKTK